MGYLERFARNRRSKEKSEVLTARLPQSLYKEFKTYCNDLGLSISEAVCLLVEHEITSNKGDETNTNEYKPNLDVMFNKHEGIENEIKTNTDVNTNKPKRTQNVSKTNTSRFTVKQYVMGDRVPCPLCNQWINHSNYARHAKTQHNSTTQEIFENQDNLKRVNEMIAERTETQGS